MRSPVDQPPGAITDFYGRSRSKVPGEKNNNEDRRHRSVVKIFTVTSSPNYEIPWQSHPPESSTGSGLVVNEGGENLILTNAHVVADATLIEVRRSGSARRYVARAHAVAHECDLALLCIDEAQDFYAGISPLEFGGVPHLRDGVVVVGYPDGGDSLCVTSGVVSRIELQRYTHSGANLLSLQIDAAINPGNSGGPAFDGSGRVVGVAFQNAPDAQSIGYVIPTPVITHFLRDIRLNSGRYLGFPSIGVICQHTENPQLRERLGLDAQGGGILVRGVHPLARGLGADGAPLPGDWLRPDDVLMTICGVDIASDGTCEVNSQERVSFAHLVQMKFPGDTCPIRVVRAGAAVDLEVPTQRLERLVPDTVYDEDPSYFVYGGLVFMPLTMGYLHEYGEDWYEEAPRALVDLWETGQVSEAGEQVALLARVLAAKDTVGYQFLAERRVLSVNGERVRNFAHLFAMVRSAAAHAADLPFVDISLESPGGDCALALKHESAAAVDDEVRHTYRIPQMASDDLLELLEAEGEALGPDWAIAAPQRGRNAALAQRGRTRGGRVRGPAAAPRGKESD